MGFFAVSTRQHGYRVGLTVSEAALLAGKPSVPLGSSAGRTLVVGPYTRAAVLVFQ